MPDITKRERHEDDDFILIACDGVWDALTSHEGGEYVREFVEKREPDTKKSDLVEGLFEDIIALDVDDPDNIDGSSDNMSAILIEFTKAVDK